MSPRQTAFGGGATAISACLAQPSPAVQSYVAPGTSKRTLLIRWIRGPMMNLSLCRGGSLGTCHSVEGYCHLAFDLPADFTGRMQRGVDVNIGLAVDQPCELIRRQWNCAQQTPGCPKTTRGVRSQTDKDACRCPSGCRTVDVRRRSCNAQIPIIDVECQVGSDQ
jgi:hypothetical protein